MAEENRVVRPFITPTQAQDWMNENIYLEIQPMIDGQPDGKAIAVNSGETQRLDSKTFLTSDFSIMVKQSADVSVFEKHLVNFAEAVSVGVKNAFSVVLIGSSNYLKFSDEISRWTIAEFAKSACGFKFAKAGGERTRAARTVHSGSTFELVVVLNQELPKVVGKPWRRGTWVAKSSYSLGNPLEGFGFTPLLLTDDKRHEFNLGANTFKFARKNPFNGQLYDSETLDDFIEFYVDEETLNLLSAAPRSAQSAFIQTEIFLSAIEFLVTEACSDPELHEKTLEDVKEKLIGKLLSALSVKENDAELNRCFQLLKQSPQSFLNQFEDLVDYKKKIIDSIGDLR